MSFEVIRLKEESQFPMVLNDVILKGGGGHRSLLQRLSGKIYSLTN